VSGHSLLNVIAAFWRSWSSTPSPSIVIGARLGLPRSFGSDCTPFMFAGQSVRRRFAFAVVRAHQCIRYQGRFATRISWRRRFSPVSCITVSQSCVFARFQPAALVVRAVLIFLLRSGDNIIDGRRSVCVIDPLWKSPMLGTVMVTAAALRYLRSIVSYDKQKLLSFNSLD